VLEANGWARSEIFRHMMMDTKHNERTLIPMKPTNMGGDEDEDEDEDVVVADADADTVLLGEGDVDDMVING